MPKSGSCMCGAVKYEITGTPTETGACHCSMCRKWSGGVYMGVRAAADTVSLHGSDNLTVYRSSDWAERGFCKTCGSSLFYRVTAPGDHHGDYHIGLGTLDDANGLEFSTELFIDQKPDSYAFAGNAHKMTGAEVFAMFESDGSD